MMSLGLSSDVWKFYTKCGPNEAQCSVCMQKLKTGGGTSNLRNHLRRKHEKCLSKGAGAVPGKNKVHEHEPTSVFKGGDRSREQIEKSLSPSTSFGEGSSSSKVPLPDSDAETASTIQSQPSSPLSLSCSPSLNLRQLTLIENLERTSSYDKGGKRAIEMTKALLYFICKQNLPHSIVETEGFRHYSRVATPLYKIPSRKTITQMVSTSYNAAVHNLRDCFQNILNFSLSADICTLTSSSRGFLVVTAHFIGKDYEKNMMEMETIMLGVRRLRESHTADNIVTEIEAVLDEFKIPKSKIVGICTDGGANMIAAVRKLLGDGRHVYCFAHLLNLVVTDGLEDDKNATMKNIIRDVKSIVTFGRHSNVFMEKLRAQQEREGAVEGSVMLLIQSVPTRWNSVYQMLQRFVKLSSFIAQVLASPNIRNAPRMLSGDDIELISEIVNILAPFDEATKEISGSNYITGSLIIPLITCIESKLIKASENNKYGASKVLSTKLISSLKARSPKLLHNPLVCYSTLLDPRFKQKYMTATDASNTVAKLSEEIGVRNISPPLCDNDNEMRVVSTMTMPSSSLWSAHDEDVAVANSSVEIESSFPKELKLYLEQPVLIRNTDPFNYWQQAKTCMSTLALVAEKYLCIVGSSVASERLVSSLNDIVSDERSRLTDKHIIERVFMNRLDNKYWTEK